MEWLGELSSQGLHWGLEATRRNQNLASSSSSSTTTTTTTSSRSEGWEVAVAQSQRRLNWLLPYCHRNNRFQDRCREGAATEEEEEEGATAMRVV
jgi:hypothetical protein